MNSHRLLTLLVLAVLVIGGAFWLLHARAPERDRGPGERVLPELTGKLNDISEVRIVTAGDKTSATLKRSGTQWQVVERGAYPADFAKLSKLLIDIGSLRMLEEKTANPTHYAVIGVEDLKSDKASGLRIDLLGLQKPVSLIVGKAGQGDGTYVRVAGAKTSLLAKPQLQVEREPKDWLDRALLDLPADRVQEVRIALAGAKPYTVTRAARTESDFSVSDLPKGRVLSSPSAPGPVAGALSNLHFDDVRSAGAENLPKDAPRPEDAKPSTVQYRLFDGTVLTLTGHKEGDAHWVTVASSFDETQFERFKAPAPEAAKGATKDDKTAKAEPQPPAPAGESAEKARKDSQALGQRLGGWAFEIPGYQYETIFRPIDELLKTPETPPKKP